MSDEEKPTQKSNYDLMLWRINEVEKQISQLTKDISVLNKAMYMMLGAVTLVQVILPLLEKYGN
jgi:hypothetical protein